MPVWIVALITSKEEQKEMEAGKFSVHTTQQGHELQKVLSPKATRVSGT